MTGVVRKVFGAPKLPPPAARVQTPTRSDPSIADAAAAELKQQARVRRAATVLTGPGGVTNRNETPRKRLLGA